MYKYMTRVVLAINSLESQGNMFIVYIHLLSMFLSKFASRHMRLTYMQRITQATERKVHVFILQCIPPSAVVFVQGKHVHTLEMYKI